MPSLADYLAKNYLTASTTSTTDSSDTRPTKKRKKNKTSITEATNTLLIADDDDDLLLSSKKNGGVDDNENDRPLMYDNKVRSAEFRKSKKNAWQTLSNSGSGGGGDPTSNDDDADRFLRETIASTAQSRADLEAENAPAIVEADTQDDVPRMESGQKAGLQTAADTARIVAEQEAREAAAEEEERRARAKRKKKNKTTTEGAQDDQPIEEQTIYRDATGRRIDLTLRRQEARKAELERIAAEKKARDDAMGAVQIQQREERKQELEDAKFLTLGRGADDEEMNARMKGEVRWNDPMAAYMANKRNEEDQQQVTSSKGVRGGQSSKTQTSASQKPKRKEYAGAAPPNRYGIKPGWRWDGVDRGNGFENDWFQARGRKARNENLEYQWQMDE